MVERTPRSPYAMNTTLARSVWGPRCEVAGSSPALPIIFFTDIFSHPFFSHIILGTYPARLKKRNKQPTRPPTLWIIPILAALAAPRSAVAAPKRAAEAYARES